MMAHGSNTNLAAQREQDGGKTLPRKRQHRTNSSPPTSSIKNLPSTEGTGERKAAPLLKRKRRANISTSLIGSMKPSPAATLHDFPSDLDLTATTGTILFPTKADNHTVKSWSPSKGESQSPSHGASQVSLADFDVNRASNNIGNNTVAIQFTAPADSKRFSINIAIDPHNNFESVLFHFNPRQLEHGGQLVLNNKQNGTWGHAIQIPLTLMPVLFGQESVCTTLIVQISTAGFDVFLGKKLQHCARLEHRTQLPNGSTKLVLQCPNTDDYGNIEQWNVHKIWWGHKPSFATASAIQNVDVAAVPGVKHHNAEHPRKIFIRGLTKIYSQSEVECRRAELERAFLKYSGGSSSNGMVRTIVPTHKTFAFVEFSSELMTDLALEELSGIYIMSRARRSKHEILEEKRANKVAKPSR